MGTAGGLRKTLRERENAGESAKRLASQENVQSILRKVRGPRCEFRKEHDAKLALREGATLLASRDPTYLDFGVPCTEGYEGVAGKASNLPDSTKDCLDELEVRVVERRIWKVEGGYL